MIKTEFLLEVPEVTFRQDETNTATPDQESDQETNELLASIIAYKLKALEIITHGKSILPTEPPSMQQMIDTFDQYKLRMVEILAQAKVMIPKRKK